MAFSPFLDALAAAWHQFWDGIRKAVRWRRAKD
jgi:hypothetical protein